METRVVCISRTLAAGGEEIGYRVAERLGFRYVDEEIVRAAAGKADVDPRLVEEAEQKQPLIERILDAIAIRTPAPEAIGLMTGFPAELSSVGSLPMSSGPEEYRTLIREVIREMADEGKAVIVAHAASMALGGAEGVLRVLVTASPEVRASRLATARALGAKEAAQAVRDSDRERRDYFKRFYGIREELPTHYDLVINTDVLATEDAIALVLCAAGVSSATR